MLRRRSSPDITPDITLDITPGSLNNETLNDRTLHDRTLNERSLNEAMLKNFIDDDEFTRALELAYDALPHHVGSSGSCGEYGF